MAKPYLLHEPSLVDPTGGRAIADSDPSDRGSAALPYWLVNVPRKEWPDECPDFLRSITDKDRGIVGTPDSEYHRLSWPEVQSVVGRCHPVFFHFTAWFHV